MVGPIIPPRKHRQLTRWLLNESPEQSTTGKHLQHPWWQ